jgi:hypothetical protein
MHRKDAKGAKNEINIKNLRVLRAFAMTLIIRYEIRARFGIARPGTV